LNYARLRNHTSTNQRAWVVGRLLRASRSRRPFRFPTFNFYLSTLNAKL